jgi:hypothetical protein
MMNEDTVGKVADATKAVAEAGGKATEAASGFGRIIKGPVEDLIGILHDRIKFSRAERLLALQDKAEAIMRQRRQGAPTRDLPMNFAIPLLTHAMLEDDEYLQETWARMLVNAGDAATPMELRTAYVEILSGMSAFDVKILAAMVEATSTIPPGQPRAVLTPNLPYTTKPFPGHFTTEPDLSHELGVSLANLSRLGCAMPGGGMDGSVLFDVMTVTDLGIALYKACS